MSGVSVVGLFMAAAGQTPVAIVAAMLAVSATRILSMPPRVPIPQKVPHTVTIEGLPGAGKSTAIKMLNGRPESISDWEPFLNWRDAEDVAGASLARQLRILSDFFHRDDGFKITERSWITCVAFAAAGPMSLGDSRYIESLLSIIRAALEANALRLPRRMVFLDCPVKTCLKRIQARAQPGDGTMTEAYLNVLNDAHEILKAAAIRLNIECVTLSGDIPQDSIRDACTLDGAEAQAHPLSVDEVMAVLTQAFFADPDPEKRLKSE